MFYNLKMKLQNIENKKEQQNIFDISTYAYA